MERTKKAGVQESFFSSSQLKRTKKGMYAATEKVGSDIEEYLIPALRQAGYRARIIQGKEFSSGLKPKTEESYPKTPPRLLLKGAGLFLEVWPKDNPKYKIVFKPFVIESTKPQFLGNRPRWNLNEELYKQVEKWAEGIRVRCLHNLMYSLDLHFLIVTKTGMFWADKFTNILKDDYYLTYRNDPKHLDRLAVRAGSQVGQFHSIKKNFHESMLTIMYYFNKNNQYNITLREQIDLKPIHP